jgi:hypothetical protein
MLMSMNMNMNMGINNIYVRIGYLTLDLLWV